MGEEVTALWDNETFELTPLPEGRTSVGGKWVYGIKLGPNGEEIYKARFVAKGYSQVPGIDYHETFSPTARITSVRMLMQLAVQGGIEMNQNKYVEIILSKFKMLDCKPKAVPCELGANKPVTLMKSEFENVNLYLQNCWKFNLSHDLHKTRFVLCCDVFISTSVKTNEITSWDG